MAETQKLIEPAQGSSAAPRKPLQVRRAEPRDLDRILAFHDKPLKGKTPELTASLNKAVYKRRREEILEAINMGAYLIFENDTPETFKREKFDRQIFGTVGIFLINDGQEIKKAFKVFDTNSGELTNYKDARIAELGSVRIDRDLIPEEYRMSNVWHSACFALAALNWFSVMLQSKDPKVQLIERLICNVQSDLKENLAFLNGGRHPDGIEYPGPDGVLSDQINEHGQRRNSPYFWTRISPGDGLVKGFEETINPDDKNVDEEKIWLRLSSRELPRLATWALYVHRLGLTNIRYSQFKSGDPSIPLDLTPLENSWQFINLQGQLLFDKITRSPITHVSQLIKHGAYIIRQGLGGWMDLAANFNEIMAGVRGREVLVHNSEDEFSPAGLARSEHIHSIGEAGRALVAELDAQNGNPAPEDTPAPAELVGPQLPPGPKIPAKTTIDWVDDPQSEDQPKDRIVRGVVSYGSSPRKLPFEPPNSQDRPPLRWKTVGPHLPSERNVRGAVGRDSTATDEPEISPLLWTTRQRLEKNLKEGGDGTLWTKDPSVTALIAAFFLAEVEMLKGKKTPEELIAIDLAESENARQRGLSEERINRQIRVVKDPKKPALFLEDQCGAVIRDAAALTSDEARQEKLKLKFDREMHVTTLENDQRVFLQAKEHLKNIKHKLGEGSVRLLPGTMQTALKDYHPEEFHAVYSNGEWQDLNPAAKEALVAGFFRNMGLRGFGVISSRALGDGTVFEPALAKGEIKWRPEQGNPVQTAYITNPDNTERTPFTTVEELNRYFDGYRPDPANTDATTTDTAISQEIRLKCLGYFYSEEIGTLPNGEVIKTPFISYLVCKTGPESRIDKLNKKTLDEIFENVMKKVNAVESIQKQGIVLKRNPDTLRPDSPFLVPAPSA
jgi:hypothetical protein